MPPRRTPRALPEPHAPSGLHARRFRAGRAEMAILWFPLTGEALTKTEHEIANALLAGKSNAAIARERGTAARTIANQIASVYRKLGVRSRAELVARAALLGGRAATREEG